MPAFRPLPPLCLAPGGNEGDTARVKSLDHVGSSLKARDIDHGDRDHVEHEPLQIRSGAFDGLKDAALEERCIEKNDGGVKAKQQ